MIYLANRASVILHNYLVTIEPSKPFLLPSNVCPVVPLSFLKAGVHFDFIDIDDTHAMSKDLCMSKLETGDYAGLLFVHAYGKEFYNMDFYSNVKSLNKDLYIIDDCCLCPPDTSEVVPENVDLQIFSTGYAKYAELSYGGYGKTELGWLKNIEYQYDSEEETKQQVYIKECFKNRRKYELDSRLPWIDFSPLKMSQDDYFSIIDAKKIKVKEGKDKINAIYNELLPDSVKLDCNLNNWRYMIYVENQKKILDAIFDNDLFAGTNFPSVSYLFKGLSSSIAEKEASHLINLFNDFRISEEQAERICNIINKVL